MLPADQSVAADQHSIITMGWIAMKFCPHVYFAMIMNLYFLKFGILKLTFAISIEGTEDCKTVRLP